MKLAKKLLAYLLPLTLAVGLLWLTYKDTNFEKIDKSLADINYGWIAFSSVFMIISHWARARRWVLIYEPLGYYPKTKHAFFAVMGGYFANLLLPRMGELTRCALLNRTDAMPIDKSVGTVLAERAADIVALLVFTLLAILLKFGVLSRFFLDLLAAKKSNSEGFSGVWILIGALIVFALFAGVVLWFWRGRLRQSSIYTKALGFAGGIYQGMISIFKIKHKMTFLVYTVLIWGSYLLTAQVSFFAFGSTSSLPLDASFMILVMGSYGMIVPVQGGFGAYHAIVALTFVRLYAMEQVPAEAAALLLHSAQTIFTLLVGGICFLVAWQIPKKETI